MTLNELIEAVPIDEYIGQYTELKWKNGELWGISPISRHDTDPSLSVRPDENVYCDFSSGSRGNIINFIMDFHHVDFRKAVVLLKEYANVVEDVTPNVTLPIVRELSRFKARANQARKSTAHTILDERELEQYRVNEFPWWENEDIDGSVAMAWGCGYDRYKDAITIPVRDNDGNLIFYAKGDLGQPSGIDSDDKYIYVGGRAGYLTIFDTDFNIVAELGEFNGDLRAHSVALDREGNVYLFPTHANTEHQCIALKRIRD